MCAGNPDSIVKVCTPVGLDWELTSGDLPRSCPMYSLFLHSRTVFQKGHTRVTL